MRSLHQGVALLAGGTQCAARSVGQGVALLTGVAQHAARSIDPGVAVTVALLVRADALAVSCNVV